MASNYNYVYISLKSSTSDRSWVSVKQQQISVFVFKFSLQKNTGKLAMPLAVILVTNEHDLEEFG